MNKNIRKHKGASAVKKAKRMKKVKAKKTKKVDVEEKPRRKSPADIARFNRRDTVIKLRAQADEFCVRADELQAELDEVNSLVEQLGDTATALEELTDD